MVRSELKAEGWRWKQRKRSGQRSNTAENREELGNAA